MTTTAPTAPTIAPASALGSTPLEEDVLSPEDDEGEGEVDCDEEVVDVDVAFVRHDASLPVVMKNGVD